MAAAFISLIFKLFILLTASVRNGNSIYPQYFQGHSLPDCVGAPVTILETNWNLFNNELMYQAKSASARGLWRFIVTNRLVGGAENVTIFTTISTHSKTECINIEPATPPFRIESAEKLNPSDLEEPVLTLYPEPNFVGTPVVINTTEYILAASITVRSWAFTGTRPFTVYSETNFKGNATCLELWETDTLIEGWGIRTYLDLGDGGQTPFTAGSVRLGRAC